MEVERFTPYLGMTAALLLGAFIIAFSSKVTVLGSPVATTTPAITAVLFTPPGLVVPPLPQPSIEPKTEATSSPSSLAPTKAPTQKTVVAPATTPVSSHPLPSSGNGALDASVAALRSALVNIICYAPINGVIHSISGSGVTIDPKGIILTNAHIAQYFLLTDRDISCIIRTGGPAVTSYKASLVYISPRWLNANQMVLTEATPSGTGQYDFAFLAITSSATSAALPNSFPYVPLATAPLSLGTPVAIASYAAQSLGYNQILSSLFPTTVFGSVKDVFTFDINSVDVVALGGSAAAQEGSSGGGVVDSSGELVGTLTTSTISGATSTRTLDAIAASYIRAEYADETGQPLDSLFSESPSTAVSNFAPQIPALEAVIASHL